MDRNKDGDARPGSSEGARRATGEWPCLYTATEAEKMSRTTSPSTHKPYSLVRICRVWCFIRSIIYWQQRTKGGGGGIVSDENPQPPLASSCR